MTNNQKIKQGMVINNIKQLEELIGESIIFNTAVESVNKISDDTYIANCFCHIGDLEIVLSKELYDKYNALHAKNKYCEIKCDIKTQPDSNKESPLFVAKDFNIHKPKGETIDVVQIEQYVGHRINIVATYEMNGRIEDKGITKGHFVLCHDGTGQARVLLTNKVYNACKHLLKPNNVCTFVGTVKEDKQLYAVGPVLIVESVFLVKGEF